MIGAPLLALVSDAVLQQQQPALGLPRMMGLDWLVIPPPAVTPGTASTVVARSWPALRSMSVASSVVRARVSSWARCSPSTTMSAELSPAGTPASGGDKVEADEGVRLDRLPLPRPGLPAQLTGGVLGRGVEDLRARERLGRPTCPCALTVTRTDTSPWAPAGADGG